MEVFQGISRDDAVRLCDEALKLMDKIKEMPFR
jgi:hypothetical protein